MGHFHILKWEGLIFALLRGKMIDLGENAIPVRNEVFHISFNKSIKKSLNIKMQNPPEKIRIITNKKSTNLI